MKIYSTAKNHETQNNQNGIVSFLKSIPTYANNKKNNFVTWDLD